jgi:hypothetical protein
MPDEPLFAAAESGRLATAEGVEAEARRLAAHARAQAGWTSFFDSWLDLGKLGSGETDKDTTIFKAFTPALKQAMRAELDRFLIDAVKAGGDTLERLLLSRDSLADEALGRLYGVTVPRGPAAHVELPPTERAGLLTRAGILTALSYPDQTSPVHRGVFVRERLLCQTLPSPPADVVVSVPKIDAAATARERFAEHSRSPSCAGCHQLMDPIGLGFESYDALGAHRTVEGGKPVDASGLIVGTAGLDGAFSGLLDLSRRLASAAEVRACVATQWLAFASPGAGESTEDAACRAQAAAAALGGAGGDLSGLALALVRTDAFRFVRRPAKEACP